MSVSGGGEEWTVTLPSDTVFEQPIVGLKPDTEYTVNVQLGAGDAAVSSAALQYTTPALPEDFPPIDVSISEPSQMEPGLTLFAPRVGWGVTQGPIVVVDAEGIVRWYYSNAENKVYEDLRRLDNGHFLFGADSCSIREVDILGNVVGMWHASEHIGGCDAPAGSIAVPVASFHHEMSIASNGNFLVLSTETRRIDNFPTSEEDPQAPTQTATLLGSVIVEFTPQGEVVKAIPLMDLIDPTRIGRDSLDTQWPAGYTSERQARDWDHCNAVIYDAASDSYYVSVRHQDAVLKVNRTQETLTWILGTPANWAAPWSDKLLTPQGDLQWPYHQHAVELTSLGLGMYDNGNYHAAAYETPGDSYSRAVIYAIDEQAMTVSQVWSYGAASGADSFYSSGMGDADWQPVTGNVLMVSAQLVDGANTYAQLLEVTPSGQRVFQLEVRGPAAPAPMAMGMGGGGFGGGAAAGAGSVYTVYRAERIADLRH